MSDAVAGEAGGGGGPPSAEVEVVKEGAKQQQPEQQLKEGEKEEGGGGSAPLWVTRTYEVAVQVGRWRGGMRGGRCMADWTADWLEDEGEGGEESTSCYQAIRRRRRGEEHRLCLLLIPAYACLITRAWSCGLPAVLWVLVAGAPPPQHRRHPEGPLPARGRDQVGSTATTHATKL